MLEIYTQKSWVSSFRNPSFIVDDEGLIYNDDDYRRGIRNPIGRIDYKTGYIYGKDYYKTLRSPTGQIQQDGAVTMVFGEDYFKNVRSPKFYVRGNEVYTSEEYYKSFPTPSYYIVTKNSNSGNANYTKSSTSSGINNGPAENINLEPSTSAIRELLKIVLIILALIFFSVGSFNNFMHDSVYSPFLVVSLAIALVCDFIIVKENDVFANIVCTEIVSALVCWICVLVTDFSTSTGFALFGTIFLNPILIALMMAIPSIVVGVIAYYIKKLFKLLKK